MLDWRRIQLRKLRRSIEVITGEELTADDIRAYGAELVVVATGSTWAADGFNVYAGGPIAADDPRTVTPEHVLDGLPDGDVAVLDCEGYLVGVGCAELALQRGRRVTYHSPFDRVAPLLDETLEAMALRPAWPRPASRWRRCRRAWRSIDAGAIVLVTQRRSDDALYHALIDDPGDVEGVYRVGDCVAPRDPGGRDLRRPPPGARDRQRGSRGARPWLRERVTRAVTRTNTAECAAKRAKVCRGERFSSASIRTPIP